MLTTNKLTKTFASGIATISIAAVAGIVNAPSASAQVVDSCANGGFFESAATLIPGTVVCGDKTFSNFSFSDPLVSDIISIENNGSEWDFDYNFTPDLVGDFDFTISYDVNIDPTNDQFFDLIELDSSVGAYLPEDGNVTIVKEIFDSFTGDLLLTLTSVDGSRDLDSILSLNTKHISVLDTITVTGEGILDDVVNGFTQDTHDVPEPGTILGLLAVGGLGMVSRFKKQK
jgi:hypothetical protein